MKSLFGRKSKAGTEQGAANAQLWRDVPKLNLLLVERRRSSAAWLPKAGLAVAVLAIGYAALFLSQERASVQEEIPKSQALQLNIEAQIADGARRLDQIRSEIAAAKQQADATKVSFAQLAESRVDWFSALTALFNAQGQGIQLISVSNPDPLVIEAAGTATNANAVARFRAQISSSAPLLQLLGMTVEPEADGLLAFSAQIRIGQ